MGVGAEKAVMFSSGRAVGRRLRSCFWAEEANAEKRKGVRRRKGEGVVAAASGHFGGRGKASGFGRAYVREVSLFSVERLPERLPGRARSENASGENEIGAGCQPR